MFFLLYGQNDINKIIEGNYQNYVIDKLACGIMENKPLRSRIQFLWIIVYFVYSLFFFWYLEQAIFSKMNIASLLLHLA